MKKYVTWAYFSVSAVRNIVLPRSDNTCATICDSTIGPKAMGNRKVSSYCVIVTRSTLGRAPVSKPSKPSTASARTIWRMRSARKLKQNTPSPERMRGVPVITRGLTNSSVSPAW